MEALFLKILSLSLGATYVSAAVIALRFLLKRTPRWIVCAMWGLVAIRLLCLLYYPYYIIRSFFKFFIRFYNK